MTPNQNLQYKPHADEQRGCCPLREYPPHADEQRGSRMMHKCLAGWRLLAGPVRFYTSWRKVAR